jgi:hypothetical protein
MICGVCGAVAPVFAVVDGFEYGDCPSCDSLAVDASVIAMIDEGRFIRHYEADYWEMELPAARQRAWGAGLALVAEAVLYSTRPIRTFIDIGCGPGFLLDALSKHLPSQTVFHGVEKFPPRARTTHPNYHTGDLADIDLECDGGVCMEVFEHLTPNMARNLVDALSRKSNEGALYMFNTGLPTLVKEGNPGYLDPLRRGHIISWGERALRAIFEPRGFKVIPMRSWAFAVEYGPTSPMRPVDRIWNSPNAHLLRDPEMGEVIFLLGRESARTYA